MWVASDWPIHDLGERYFYWVHMVQHTTYAIIAAPLLLMGTPAWLARWLLSPRWLLKTVRYLTRLIPATLIFNFVIIVTHIPVVVDASLHNGLLHFSIHALILVSSLIVWMPVLSPLPEVPRLQPLARMLFLFLQSVVPTVPASFLTFGDHPLYKFYETGPAPVGHLRARRHALRRAHHEDPRRLQHLDHDHRHLLPVAQCRGEGLTGAARLARSRPRTDGVAAAMTDTQTEEREPPKPASSDAEPTPFWHRPYVERYLTPLVLPVAVILGLVAYIINISRIFLSGHGHIPIFVGSIITAMILIGATLLSAGAERLRSSAITLVGAAFIFSIMSAGWLVLGHCAAGEDGPDHAARDAEDQADGGGHRRARQAR